MWGKKYPTNEDSYLVMIQTLVGFIQLHTRGQYPSIYISVHISIIALLISLHYSYHNVLIK